MKTVFLTLILAAVGIMPFYCVDAKADPFKLEDVRCECIKIGYHSGCHHWECFEVIEYASGSLTSIADVGYSAITGVSSDIASSEIAVPEVVGVLKRCQSFITGYSHYRSPDVTGTEYIINKNGVLVFSSEADMEADALFIEIQRLLERLED